MLTYVAHQQGTRAYQADCVSRNLSLTTTGSTTRALAHPILRLQRMVGNIVVQRWLRSNAIQAKLKINQPGDKYEWEADRVAEQVMLMPEPDNLPSRCACSGMSGPDGECEGCQRQQLRLQRRATNRAEPTTVPPIVHQVWGSPGQPLEPATRAFMEPRFDHDFSQVRVHTGARAAESARAVNASAYTVGRDIVFGAGQYAPGSADGERLLAHELTHVVQQSAQSANVKPTGDLSISSTPERVARQLVVGGTKSAEFLRPGWVDVNEVGILYKPGGKGIGGANLRKTPGGDLDMWLPQNTRVYILKHHPKERWYAVTVISDGGGRFGYIADWLVMRNLPDPDAEVLKIESGQSPIDIARKHYADKGFSIWGMDQRYVVNALVWVNAHAKHNFPGEVGISKPRFDASWFLAKSTAGSYIWLPGAKHLKAIYEKVAEEGGGTGSITADLWRGVKKIYEHVAYGLAFVGGLVHGFVKSIYDAVAGLVEIAVDILVSVFTGNVVKDAKELWQAVSKITWEGVKEALGEWWHKWERKLLSSDPWVAGHAHGYLTGYIMAEVAQLLLTAGTAAALKSTIMGSRLGKAIKGTRAFTAFVKGMEKIGEGSAAVRKVVAVAGEAIRHSKPFKALKIAKEWVIMTLKVGREFVKDLSLEAINRLRMLSDKALARISRLSKRAKRWLLGCASPCKVELEAIEKKLAGMTDDEIEKALSPIDPKKHSPAKKPEVKEPKKTKKPVIKPLLIEDIVKEARKRLKERGIKGLPPSEYGTRLHAVVREIVLEKTGKVPAGWIAASEKELGKIVKLRPENAALTVREYMTKWGMTERYPGFPEKFLDKKIGKLKPDLFVRSPEGRALVWDVTSKLDELHVAKTMFYAEVIGREFGSFFRISESYWRVVF